jgi:hypothetical protein
MCAYDLRATLTTTKLEALLWVVLMIRLGVTTLRKGHWVLFILGIFLPLVWIIGAVMAPKHAAQPV